MGANVGKRLDRFLIKESLVDLSSSFKSQVLHYNIYDHFPVALHLDVNPHDSFRPFKFDHSWLKSDEFFQVIKVFCENYCSPGFSTMMDHFIIKLKALKKEVVSWTKRKSIKNRYFLQQTESVISDILMSNSKGFCSAEIKDKLSAIQIVQDEILLKNEEKLRLKRRSIWLEAGDINTIFFKSLSLSH